MSRHFASRGLSASSQNPVRGAVVRHSVHTVRSPCASGAPQTGQRGGKKSAATSRSRSLRIDIADDGYRFEFGIFGERLQLGAQQ